MAQTFMQSFGSAGQGPSSSSAGTFPYSTPLGPLSPYSGGPSSVSYSPEGLSVVRETEKS